MKLTNASSHRSGQGWLTVWTPEKVVAAPDQAWAFAEYAQQVLGVPWPTVRDMATLRKKIKVLFEQYPQADYYTLCRLVVWCKSTRRRYGRVWAVVEAFRDAYVAKALPELDAPVVDDRIEKAIERALERETDPAWRSRLLVTSGMELRRRTLAEWIEIRATT